ncbi:MAG: tetratricopeptide repeat protein [Planctomycetes bacterium]|nr:tetratricopeptide repeat protein [Planctomycetota bacterium]
MTLFSSALDLESAEERAGYLDKACAGAPALRARVEALLRAHDHLGPFLAPDPPPGSLARQPAPEQTAPYDGKASLSNETIGPYRLLQVIGQGGMGTVYMAEQSEPVRRRVALKVVRPGLDGRQILSRFEAERQALAMMDHPNIARVFDAGAAADGRPYFVMELVKGVPITTFCDERRLSPRERIDLFVAVCQAVQHAHQKGVIHRDLKPSNVLVALYDDKAVPKVIDFGVAKAAGTSLTDGSVFTEFGAIIGTLEYMSPEQAQLNQLDVDTRSDVYSLGVLLYELLTGTTPMDRKVVGQVALMEVLRHIREVDTPRPSQRLSTVAGLATIAAARGLDPGKLGGLIRGDLDWIVMKALEKDRVRRYESPGAMARDLQRHLRGDEVEACPPSTLYRFRKFARRHRVALSASAAIVTTLLIATAVSAWQAVRATRAERAAVESAEVERQTITFLVDDLLGSASLSTQVIAGITPDPDIKVRTLVDRAAARIDGRFADQPLVESSVRHSIGRVYHSLGLFEEARRCFERCSEIRRHILGEDHPATLRAAADLGQCETDLGLHDAAEKRLRHTLDLATRLSDDQRNRLEIMTLGMLGTCLEAAQRHDEADATFRRALELTHKSPEVHSYQRLVLQNNLAISLTNRGDEAGAETLLHESLREALKAGGDDHPMVPLIRDNLSLIQRNQGHFRRAEQTARAAYESSQRLFGDRHPSTLAALRNVGLSEMGLGRAAEAEATLRRALDLARQGYGAESETTMHSAIALAGVLLDRGTIEEAEALLRECLPVARRYGPEYAANVEGNLGMVSFARGNFVEAEQWLRKAESVLEALPSVDVRFLLALKRDLAYAIGHQGRHQEALERFRAALRKVEAIFGRDDHQTFHLLAGLVHECRALGLDAEGEALYPRLIRLGDSLLGSEARNALAVKQNYAAVLHVRGKFEAAEELYRAGIEGFTKAVGPEDVATLQTISNLGELYRDWGRPDDAVPLLQQALHGHQRTSGADHPHTLWTLWKLAELERDRGRFDEAQPMFERCLAGYAKAQSADGLELAQLRADLALNHLKKREPERAEALLREALRAYEKQLPDDWRRFEIMGLLGEALSIQARFEEAEPLVLESFAGMEARHTRVTVDAWPRRPLARRRVVPLYEAWGKPALTAKWRQEPATEASGQPPPKIAAPAPAH